jgi:maltose-binding protein MalE
MSRDDAIREIAQQVAQGRLTRRDALRRAGALGISATAIGAALATPLRVGAQATPAAASYTPKGPQVEKLVLWTRSSKDTSPLEWGALEAVTKAYTDAVGTPVQMVTVPDADFRTKLSQAAPGGQGPDVFGPVAHDWIGEVAIQKIAYPWPQDQIPDVADIPQPAIDAVTYNGEIYGFPVFSETLGFQYYSDQVSEPPATWEDMVPMATELTKGDTYGFSFQLLQQYYQGAFFHAFGGYIFASQDGTLNTDDIGLNNDGSVEAAKFIRDIYWKKAPPQPEAVLDQANAGQFLNGLQESGNLVMTIDGPWREPTLQAAGIQYGITPLMTVNGKQLQPFVGFQAFEVNAYGKSLDASVDLVSFIGSTDGVKLMIEGFGKPPVRDSLRDYAIGVNPNLGIWMDAAGQGVPMPNIPQMAEVWQPWGDAMVGIVTNNVGDDEVQGLLDAAVEQIKANIAKSGS